MNSMHLQYANIDHIIYARMIFMYAFMYAYLSLYVRKNIYECMSVLMGSSVLVYTHFGWDVEGFTELYCC